MNKTIHPTVSQSTNPVASFVSTVWSKILSLICIFTTIKDAMMGAVEPHNGFIRLSYDGFLFTLTKMDSSFTLKDYKIHLGKGLLEAVPMHTEGMLSHRFPFNNELKGAIIVATRENGDVFMMTHDILGGFIPKSHSREEAEKYIATTLEHLHSFPTIYFVSC